jgi:hypothetical protein
VTEKAEKYYLFVYSSTLGTREQIKACLDKIPQILRWRTDLPNSFYLVSHEEHSNELTDLITECMGKRGRFVILEVPRNVQGWLVPETWVFLGRK